jgi:hypothetical protein
MRQDSWPYRGMFTRKWELDEQGRPTGRRINYTFMEILEYLATGGVLSSYKDERSSTMKGVCAKA